MNNKSIDTLILSGGGPSGIAYVGIFKALYDKNIIQKNLSGIKEIITTSIGILFTITNILNINQDILKNIIIKYDSNNYINYDNLKIDDILIDFGLFDTDKISNIIQSILKNCLQIDDLTLDELYKINPIKLTVKVFNVTEKKVEYISHETDPKLSILTLSQMTTAIPFFFKPVKYNDNLYVDGGMRGNFPLENCKSNNYLGLFIRGSLYPKESNVIKLFPILDFMYSLMINSDNIEDHKKNKNIIFFEIDQGLDFNISDVKKESILQEGYTKTINHINTYFK